MVYKKSVPWVFNVFDNGQMVRHKKRFLFFIWRILVSSFEEAQLISGSTFSEMNVKSLKGEEEITRRTIPEAYVQSLKEEEVIIGGTSSETHVEKRGVGSSDQSNLDWIFVKEKPVKSVLLVDEETPLNPSKSRRSSRKKGWVSRWKDWICFNWNRLRFYLFLLGLICIGLLFIALLTALIVWKFSSSFGKGTITSLIKPGEQRNSSLPLKIFCHR